jgi:hypothetical protein
MILEKEAKQLKQTGALREFIFNLYINKRVINILRERMRKIVLAEIEETENVHVSSPVNIKDAPKIPCNMAWPVCHVKLSGYKLKPRKKSFIVFKQNFEPIIIDNYFAKKREKKKKPIKKLTALESMSFAPRKDIDSLKRTSFIGHPGAQLMGNATSAAGVMDILLIFRQEHICREFLEEGPHSDVEANEKEEEEHEEEAKVEPAPKRGRETLKPNVKARRNSQPKSKATDDLFSTVEIDPCSLKYRQKQREVKWNRATLQKKGGLTSIEEAIKKRKIITFKEIPVKPVREDSGLVDTPVIVVQDDVTFEKGPSYDSLGLKSSIAFFASPSHNTYASPLAMASSLLLPSFTKTSSEFRGETPPKP